MKNRIILLLILFFSILLSLFSVNANEQFNFDVTEIEVTNDGNTFKVQGWNSNNRRRSQNIS